MLSASRRPRAIDGSPCRQEGNQPPWRYRGHTGSSPWSSSEHTDLEKGLSVYLRSLLSSVVLAGFIVRQNLFDFGQRSNRWLRCECCCEFLSEPCILGPHNFEFIRQFADFVM